MCLTQEGFNQRMTELKKAVEEFKKENKVEKVKVIWVSTALDFVLEKADEKDCLSAHLLDFKGLDDYTVM